jgi:hypothetical protein
MAIIVTKEMGLTHRDFYRTFPSVAGSCAWYVTDNTVTLEDPVGPITISLGPERRRQIALISLPTTILRFEFTLHNQAEVEAFITRFDTCFRRGGG